MFNEEFGGQGQLQAPRQGCCAGEGGILRSWVGGLGGGGLGFNRKRNELGVWGEPLHLLPES